MYDSLKAMCKQQTELLASVGLLIIPGQSRKHRLQNYLCFCMRLRFSGNVFTKPLPRTGSGIFAYLAVVA
jgi:hypothetical protein